MADNVRILPDAERDIADAFEWYEERRRGYCVRRLARLS